MPMMNKYFTLKAGYIGVGKLATHRDLYKRPVFELFLPHDSLRDYLEIVEHVCGKIYYCSKEVADFLEVDLASPSTLYGYYVFDQTEILWLNEKQLKKFKLKRALAQL